MCGNCHLSVNLPTGADYATIADQIEPKLCGGRIPIQCHKIVLEVTRCVMILSHLGRCRRHLACGNRRLLDSRVYTISRESEGVSAVRVGR
jgi:hypothetical protein